MKRNMKMRLKVIILVRVSVKSFWDLSKNLENFFYVIFKKLLGKKKLPN